MRTACVVLALLGASLPFSAQAAFAATGSVLADFVPGGATGNGRGIAFDGTNLWYTIVGDSHIYHVTTTGASLGSVLVAGSVSTAGPLAWDGSHLWTADYSSPSSKLFEVDPGSGAVLGGTCDYVAANPLNPAVPGPKGISFFPDGLDFGGGTFWMSGESSGNPANFVANLDTSCKILSSFVAPPLTGADGISGNAVVVDPFNGDKLWNAVEGDNSPPQIFQTDTSGVPTGLAFPTPHDTEDLAFDPVTFAPKCAVWGNEASFGANHLTAYEVPCAEQPISATGTTFSATEGSSFSGTVATFTDPDPNSTAAEYSATINWGDTTSSSGTVSGPTGGPFIVSGTHTYTEEGTYTVTVTIRDVDTPSNTATATSTARVADAPLTAGTLTLSSGAVEGGTPETATFTFTDANPFATTADFTVTCSWGDSSSSLGTVSGSGSGPYTATCSHSYAEEGSYPVTVTVADDGGSTTSGSGTASVADAALTAGTLTLSPGVEGTTPVNASFRFTDANAGAPVSDFTATCSWGDSSSSPGTVAGGGGSYTVTCSHTYAEEGSYTVTVTVTDDGGSTTSKSGSATVADAPLTAACAAKPVSPQAFSGSTATFTDADPGGIVTDYTATINWGDTTSSTGTIAGGPGNGPYTVSGSHTYTSTGFFTVTTTIVDHFSTATATCKVLIFAFAPGRGSFVIGDKNSATGTSVTFWGAQWSKDNSLSGGDAPASFKGYALNPKTPACSTDWSTDPGNSAPPPDGPLPAFMGVIVSSSITKSGSQISGNTPHIVVVQTNAGYDSNPGHAGTGKVVAQYC